jgi:hypothetical protein
MMRRYRVLVLALMVVVDAGSVHAQTPVSGCPQPAGAERRHRIVFDDRGMLSPACAAVIHQRVLPALADASDVIVFASGWRSDPAAVSVMTERFIDELLHTVPPAGGEVRPLALELDWPSAYFPFHSIGAAFPQTPPLPTSGDLFTDTMTRLFPWMRGQPDVERDLRDIFGLLSAEAGGQRPGYRDFLRLAAILKRWDFLGAPDGESRAEARHTEAPGEASIFDLETERLAQYMWDTAYLWQGPREGRVPPSLQAPLNVFTFWQMKRRAGVVGVTGAAELMRTIRRARQDGRSRPRVHLVGHGFGGKLLVASLTAATPGQVSSLVLLQATLSQLAFSPSSHLEPLWKSARGGGAYASIVRPGVVDGPIVVTQTSEDVASVFWFPMGLRITPGVLEKGSQVVTPYGSLAAYGAQRVDARYAELVRGRPIMLPERGIVNVRADRIIRRHDDILSPEVSDLVRAAFRWRASR